jgi:hypothetical protein
LCFHGFAFPSSSHPRIIAFRTSGLNLPQLEAQQIAVRRPITGTPESRFPRKNGYFFELCVNNGSSS